MPVSTENIRRWIEQSDIDYITQYIKVWIPFNAWYNANYPDLNSDREKINSIKNNGNTIRNKINTLMENDGQESLEFKSFLASLHQQLLTTDVQGSNGRIWFQDIVKEPNINNQITEDYRQIHYFIRVKIRVPGAKPDLMGIVSSLRKTVGKHNDPSYKSCVDILAWFTGLESSNNQVWNYLNKGTHEESNRDDFDSLIVEEVLNNLIQLETELHKKKAK